MRILIVEDDKKIAQLLLNGFRQNGFVVDHAANGLDALALARTAVFDLAVLDVMLPGLDGLSAVRSMRAEKIVMPVIMLSAKASVDDRIRGLQSGGDDYVTKPFAFSELLARVQSLLRRANREPETATELRAGDLTLNLLTREARRGDNKIELHPHEFALLELLLRNEGRVFTKTFLLERIWDYGFDPQTNVVDVLVCRLRSKIDRDFAHKYVRTIRGAGYVLKSH